MPVQMSGTPSPPKAKTAASSPKTTYDAKSTKFGGDRSVKTTYTGPSKKWSAKQTGPILADEVGGGGWGVHASGATRDLDAVKDKRTKFEKDFDAKQALWQDNDDRNDDALYHRSFDDGSMHLVSSKFRDGKPVDQHGKEITGMGAAAVTKYRRHDLQGATVEGESATFTPLDEDNSTLRYFAATEMKNHERGWSGLKGAPPWDPSPYRKVPYELRGMKTITNEPWVEDVKASPETNYASAGLARLDDGQNDSAALLFQRRFEENQKIAGNRGLIPWHQSPVLWRFPSGQAGRSIEYGETDTTLANEYKYTSHIQNGQNMALDVNIGSTHLLR